MGVENWSIYQKSLKKDHPDTSEEEQKQLELEIAKHQEGLVTLSLEKAKEDFAALAKIGHTEICVLSGEEISADVSKVIDYVQAALDTEGINEVILNMGAYNKKIFRMIKEHLDIPPGKKIQHRIFQETYDWQQYEERFTANAPETNDPKNPDALSKRYWIQRKISQGEALGAGFDEVGIGALFGLTEHPFKEIRGLSRHADELVRLHGKEPKRCALPFGNMPDDVKVDIPNLIPGRPDAREITELIYAMARLVMPTRSLVSSERDEPELLQKLDKYANHTTLFVHPGPERNIASLQELELREKTKSNVVEQAKVHYRFPREAILDWLNRGYHIVGFDWKQYLSTEENAQMQK